eukprot:1142476-Rhodomonas_salina.1
MEVDDDDDGLEMEMMMRIKGRAATHLIRDVETRDSHTHVLHNLTLGLRQRTLGVGARRGGWRVAGAGLPPAPPLLVPCQRCCCCCFR